MQTANPMRSALYSARLPLERPRITVRRTFVEVDDDEDDSLNDDDISSMRIPWTRAQTDPAKVPVTTLGDLTPPPMVFERAQTDPAKVEDLATAPGPLATAYSSWSGGLSSLKDQAGSQAVFGSPGSSFDLGNALQPGPSLGVPRGLPGMPVPPGHGAELPRREAAASAFVSDPLAHLGFDISQAQLRALQEDPELAHIFEDIKAGRKDAALAYYQDADLMSKLARKLACTQVPLPSQQCASSLSGPMPEGVRGQIQGAHSRNGLNTSERVEEPAPFSPDARIAASAPFSPDARISDALPAPAASSSSVLKTSLDPVLPSDGRLAAPVSDDLKSAGSVGHPEACGGECLFYFFRGGCRAGTECRFCHEYHPRNNPRKNRRALRRLAETAEGDDPASKEEDIALVAVPGAKPVEVLKNIPEVIDKNLPVSQIVVFRYPTPEIAQQAERGRLVLPVGVQVRLPARVTFEGGMQEPALHFTVKPNLPAGLHLDKRSGQISGAAVEEQQAFAQYEIAVAQAGQQKGKTLATTVLEIRTVSLQRYCLNWGWEEKGGLHLWGSLA